MLNFNVKYIYPTKAVKGYITLLKQKANYSSVITHRGRDRMVVGITTTYTISAYHH